MHGLIFETSVCYWQDQPDFCSAGGAHTRARALAHNNTRVCFHSCNTVARLRTSGWVNGYGRARERGRLTPTPSRARTQPTAPLTLLLPSWVLPSGGAPVSSRRGTSPRTPPPNTRPLVARLPAADDARTHARAPPAHRPLPLAAARTAAHRVPARTSPHRVCAGVGHRPSSPASTQTLSSVCEHPRRGLPGLAGPSDQPHPAPRGACVVTGFSADHPVLPLPPSDAPFGTPASLRVAVPSWEIVVHR